jgi:hypothetical protein
LDSQVVENSVRVYRAAEALVEVQLPQGFVTRSDVPVGVYRDGFGRLVSAFDSPVAGTAAVGGISLVVRPNPMRFEARLVTILRRVGNQWEAEADYEARVMSDTGGLADSFRWDIPAEWIGPFVMTPEMPHEVHELPGQRRHLVIRPPQPVSDRFRVRVQGVMKREGNELGQPPNIVPLDAVVAERFLVLPRQLEQQRLDWETPGLTDVPLSDAWPDSANEMQAANDFVAYRVSGRGRAVVADVQRAPGRPQVLLADICVAYLTTDACSGIATFVVDPAGPTTCTLHVPAGCELVQVQVATASAAMVPLGDRRWQVRLASGQLPQQVQVIFRRQPPQPDQLDPQTVEVPWIVDLEVARTFWTLCGRGHATWSSPGNEVYAVPKAKQELERLRLLNQAVGVASETMLDNPISELQAWYAPWVTPIASAVTRITHQPWLTQGEGLSGVAVAAEMETIVREQDVIAGRLDASMSVRKVLQQPARLPEARDFWSEFHGAPGQSTHLTFAGSRPALQIIWQPAPFWPTPATWWKTGLIALILGGWFGHRWIGPGRAYTVDTYCVWPCAAGIGIGFAWGLWVSPSILGWLLVAGCLAWPLARQLPLRRNWLGKSSASNTAKEAASGP